MRRTPPQSRESGPQLPTGSGRWLIVERSRESRKSRWTWLMSACSGAWLLSRVHTVGAGCQHESENIDIPESEGATQRSYTSLTDGVPENHDVRLNRTRLYRYEITNVTTMNQPDRYRKLLISLEPCEGVVFLFVRKTRRCWPNVHSCCQPLPGTLAHAATNGRPTAPPCNLAETAIRCEWTHFHSIVDGTRNAAPTFFEVPLSATKYFISVFAPREPNELHHVEKPRYRLTVLSDIGAYPRPGLQGRLQAKQTGETSVQLSWDPATFVPVGVSGLSAYRIYSTILMDEDEKENEAVFLKPSKIMNTVCGLERNAVNYGAPVPAQRCNNGVCSANVEGIVPKRRYMFNIVADSMRSFNATYAGVILSARWNEPTQVFDDKVIGLIGAVTGTVVGVVVIGYLWIVKLYN